VRFLNFYLNMSLGLVLDYLFVVGQNQKVITSEPAMLKTIGKWIKWMKEFTKKSTLAVAGLAVSGVLGVSCN